MGKIADPPQQPSGDPRRAACPPRNFARAACINPDAEQPRAAGDDPAELLFGIERQPDRNAEPVTQRCGQQPGAGGCTDQRERRQIDPDRARRWPLANDQIKRAVLHRRIEHLFHLRIEPVDLVDEQDIALFQIGQQRGQITRLGDHRAAGGPEPNPQFARNNLRQRSLPQPRRAKEQDRVHRLPARFGAFDEDAKVVLGRRLPHEFGERLRTKRRIGIVGEALGGEVGVVSHNSALRKCRTMDAETSSA